MQTSFKKVFLLWGLIFLISACGSVNDGSLSGDSATISLTIQNPDPNAKGTAKAVSGVEQSKAASSSTLSTCTLSASGPNSASTTVTVPSGASQIEASLDVPVGSGYTITAECLDSDKTSNGVGAGIRGSTSNVNISGSNSVSISALFLNLASRSSGDWRYCRVKQDSGTQVKILCGFNGTMTAAQKTTAQCNIEIDSALSETSPSTVSAANASGLVTGTKGKPYFILGAGSVAPTCFEYNTSGAKILKGTGAWSTDGDGNTTMECAIGVRQTETIATGRNARFAAACSKDTSTWVVIPSSGMAEFKTSTGGDSDVAGVISTGSACSTSRNGETCSSGLCGGNGICAAVPSPTLAADVTNAAGSGVAGSADGSATAATFSGPNGACISPDGNTMYVLDTSNSIIRKIDFTVATTSSSFVTLFAGIAGLPGSTNGACATAKFKTPTKCVVSSDNVSLFVTESTVNHDIRKITLSSCQVTTFAGTGASGFVNGTGTSASFNGPAGLSIDANGTLYVGDSGNNAIRKITSDGVVTTLAGGCSGTTDGTGTAACFSAPASTVLDAGGAYLYVLESTNGSIRVVNTTTQGVTTLVNQALTVPVGITIEPSNDNLYIVQGATGENVKKIALPSGTVTVVAGSFGNAGSTNGNGTSAKFNAPNDVIFNLTGTILYVIDNLNNKIRQIQ